jgi:hypothetical protein
MKNGLKIEAFGVGSVEKGGEPEAAEAASA